MSAVHSPELRARVLSLRGKMSASVVSDVVGIKAASVLSIWHRALVRGTVEPLATRYGIPGAPIVMNSVEGRIRKRAGKKGHIVEGAHPHSKLGRRRGGVS